MAWQQHRAPRGSDGRREGRSGVAGHTGVSRLRPRATPEGSRPSAGEGAQEQRELQPQQDASPPPCSPLGHTALSGGRTGPLGQASSAWRVQLHPRPLSESRELGGEGPRWAESEPSPGPHWPRPGGCLRKRDPHSEGPHGNPGTPWGLGTGRSGPLDSRQLGRLVSALQSGFSGLPETSADPVSLSRSPAGRGAGAVSPPPPDSGPHWGASPQRLPGSGF